jgi:hypothetical protein
MPPAGNCQTYTNPWLDNTWTIRRCSQSVLFGVFRRSIIACDRLLIFAIFAHSGDFPGDSSKIASVLAGSFSAPSAGLKSCLSRYCRVIHRVIHRSPGYPQVPAELSTVWQMLSTVWPALSTAGAKLSTAGVELSTYPQKLSTYPQVIHMLST